MLGGFQGITVDVWTAPGTTTPTPPTFVGLIGPFTGSEGIVHLTIPTGTTIAAGETVIVVAANHTGDKITTISDSGGNGYHIVPGVDASIAPSIQMASSSITTTLVAGDSIDVNNGGIFTGDQCIACALVFTKVSHVLDTPGHDYSHDPSTAVSLTVTHTGDLFVTAAAYNPGDLTGPTGGGATGASWEVYVNEPASSPRPAFAVAALVGTTATVTAAWHAGGSTHFQQMLAAFLK